MLEQNPFGQHSQKNKSSNSSLLFSLLLIYFSNKILAWKNPTSTREKVIYD
jgi:hypothetical protein